jgi:hypothetical protein
MKKQALITDYYKPLKKRKFNYDTNRCISCNIDLGIQNPRQYCGKIFCWNLI